MSDPPCDDVLVKEECKPFCGKFETPQSSNNSFKCKTELKSENFTDAVQCLMPNASTAEKKIKINLDNCTNKSVNLRSCLVVPRRRCDRNQRRGRKFYGRARNDSVPIMFNNRYPVGMEVPRADPHWLELIANDPIGMVWVGQHTKEVRFYGETALVILEWDDARDLSFQSGSRRVIIDDLDIITLPFNSPYTQYSLYDGHDVNIRLGAPTRDVFVDGKFFDPVFGGPPVDIPINGCSHRIQLGGPLPHICIGTTKRNDLLLGRISLVVDDNVDNLFTVYLDTKLQRFEIDKVPFTLKFDERLMTAFINGVPFRVEFGGAPIFLTFNDKTHSIRFSHLPLGIVPGFVNLVNLECITYDPIGHNLNAQIPNNTSGDLYNYHYHYHYHCSAGDRQNVAPPISGAKQPLAPPTVEYKVLLEPPDLNAMVDVNELFRKLVEKGIVQQTAANKEENVTEANASDGNLLKLDITKPETFKSKNLSMIRELYKGNQCNSCGSRFLGNDAEFIDHLKSHESGKKNNCSKWWCHWSEFLSDCNETVCWFERNNKYKETVDNDSSATISVEDYAGDDVMCICDSENFEELPEEKKMECCVTNVEEDLTPLEKSLEIEVVDESIVVDNSSICETIDILSEEEEEFHEELEPGEIAEDCDESEDIIEIVDIKPTIETIELSDDEIEEGEIIEDEEPLKKPEELFSLDKVKKEKPDVGVGGHFVKRSEKVFLDGNCEYKSASLVKPNRIKVNISRVLPVSREIEDSGSEMEDWEEPVQEQQPVSVKTKISQADIKVNITKRSGKDYSALCSIM